ncbi:pentapeptide repeat-containing protein [Streptomyces nigra]|uniref:pentapeptide repeat-containing protein n=1 Tax=Streptomyces nigra TaxID=1827580 RepID=UPI00343D31CB
MQEPSGALADLRGDCANCFGLCCVALPFSVSADFAMDKAAGTPCRNLRDDHRCGIHARLRDTGFTGCTVYDCFGAGQKVSQVTFGGEDWRTGPAGRVRRMSEVFPVVRQLHELLWYLTEALSLPVARPLRTDLRALLERTEKLTRGTPDDLAALDVAAHRRQVDVLLLRTSELARAGVRGRGKNRRGADLRGAYLIAADLTRADLRGADLIGADLRDTDLTDADLTDAFFLTQPQVNAARGSAGTRLPGSVTRPAHWTAQG